MFIAFKRLFSRDQIKRETFAMRFYQTASNPSKVGDTDQPPFSNDLAGKTNLDSTSLSGSVIFTDLGASTQKFNVAGGQYGIIVDSAQTSRQVGLMFYDAGIAVFDLAQIVSGTFIETTGDDGLEKLDITVSGLENVMMPPSLHTFLTLHNICRM